MTTEIVRNNPWMNDNMIVKESNCEKPVPNEQRLAQKLEEAKAGIGETDKVKEESLAQFREWINQNGDIQNCITDDKFLLRFLRTKKYSLFLSQQMILKYLNLIKHFDQYMNMLDFQETKVMELINSGYIFASPFRDSEGRRVVIYNSAKYDFQKYSNVDVARAHVIAWEAVIEDEETQILGVNHVADISGASAAHSTLFGVNEFARMITWGEQSFPMRIKEIHMLNVPSVVRYIYEFAVTKMSKKLKGRFMIEESTSALTSKVDKNCLPLELGGVMPKAEMVQLWKEELLQKRDRMMSLRNIKLLSDRGIITRRTLAEHTSPEGLSGSFRKLEVD